ncbi:hypothetical protein TcasGA2_TC031381 [Tribolium castaneum]|uniref:DUF4455 domain-containing protein n=1 Tax=Tribolium castaneum TaxID=7070 RepID=A0A139WAZ8_TRICA|nr:hypothetical protein TcasGA2_TC031381 [Tribolium castaneum]
MNFRPLTEEYANVATIPANVAPVPGSSKAIERLLTKRQNEHKSTLDFLRRECRKINLQIEDEIRNEGNSLKESLGKIKAQLDRETSVFKDSGEEELANLCIGTFETSVQDLNNRRLAIIDQFYDKLQDLEKKRLRFFKRVFNEAYRKTGKINHLLPYDLAYFFDQEITKTNEISLSNYGHYAQIHTDLKLQIQEEIRVFFLNLHDLKERHKVAVTNMRWKEVIVPREHVIETTKLPFLGFGDPNYADVTLPMTATDLAQWEQGIQTTLESLDANAKKLISLYKMAVLQIFNRFFDDMKVITNTLTDESDQASNHLNLEAISSEPYYKSLLVDVAELYTCDIAELQNLWTNITTYMESNINNTNIFLKNSAHLWDNHFARTDEIKKLVLKEMTNLIEKHHKLAQNFEKKMYNALDKLREGSSTAKLNKHLKEVNKFLDATGNLYSSQCAAEIKLLKKYYDLTEQECELLISELDRFLSENADKEPILERKSWQNINGLQEHEQVSPTNSEDDLIPYQMKSCQYQVDAVNNWMFGLWEAIKSYMVTCRSELLNQAEQWMEKVKTKLRKRLEIREATLRPRYSRVKTMIYDVRLKELENHQTFMQKLENKVQKYVADSHQSVELSKEKRVKIVENFESEMKEIEEKLKNATKSFQVAACIEQTKTLSGEVRRKFDETFHENYSEIEQNRKNINAMICHFGTSIKLFSEGGDFSRDEAKIYKKRFQKIQKSVPKKFKKVYAEFEASKPPILNTFRRTEIAILDRLNKSLQEFEHNEKTCDKIRQLRENIRKLAYETKFKVHRIDACIDYFRDMSKIEIWKRKHFDIMRNALQECIEKIVEIGNFVIGDGENIGKSYIFQLSQLIDSSFEEIEQSAQVSLNAS